MIRCWRSIISRVWKKSSGQNWQFMRNYTREDIFEMIEEEDKVTVPKLMQKTGLSRGFFYKNPEVRKAVDRALQLQAGMVDKRRKILDMAMDNRILQLEQQVAKLKRENETLRKENEAMRKALNKRDLNLIKNF